MSAQHNLERRSARRLPALPVAFALACVVVLLVLLSLQHGTSGHYTLGEVGRGLCCLVGAGEGLDPARQAICELRLWRALVAAAVGGSLSLSGGLLQGLFRNGLASPSLVGVSGGAALGASLVIASLGGMGPSILSRAAVLSPVAAAMLVTGAAFCGALGACWLVMRLSSTNGRISVPTLLLVGIAINTCVAGALAALQYWSLSNFQVARAILAWTFGTLDDRTGWQAGLAWAGLLLSSLCVPFVSFELDLFSGGEQDAQALGVDTPRIKLLVLLAAALCAAVAVSVAGQIAFVGLIVPHVVRLVCGPQHRGLLSVSVFAGAVFLLGTDWLQRSLLGERALQPGVLMSLLGGPFFLWLLLRNKRAIEGW